MQNMRATLKSQPETVSNLDTLVQTNLEQGRARAEATPAPIEKKKDLSEQYAESKKELAGQVASLTEKIAAVDYDSNEGIALRKQRTEALEKLDTVESKKDTRYPSGTTSRAAQENRIGGNRIYESCGPGKFCAAA